MNIPRETFKNVSSDAPEGHYHPEVLCWFSLPQISGKEL